MITRMMSGLPNEGKGGKEVNWGKKQLQNGGLLKYWF